MSKKLRYFLFLAFATGGMALAFFLSRPAQNNPLNGPCPFCQESILNLQKFYEDDLVIALYTHKPIFPGHSLIIPKRHVERFEMLSDAELVQIGRTIKKINQAAEIVFGTSSYLILQKNGLEVGQTVPHVHFHYIPRHLGDDSTIKFFFQMYMANFRDPMTPAEIKEVADQMRTTITNTTTNH